MLVQVSAPGSAKTIDELTPAGWLNSQAAQERAAISTAAVASVVDRLAVGGIRQVEMGAAAPA